MKAVQTISAVALAFLVLVSSTSFTVGMHVCMDEIQDIALFSKAAACEKELSPPPCDHHAKASCCEDETFVHEADDFKASAAHYDVVVFTAMPMEQALVLISELIPAAPLASVKYYHYSPPLRSSDLTVQHQVFLI